MAANKRKQDEKHLKILREMVALPHNKQCFDCHQRGPTYVNMTNGAFVCTSCSGMLRGLNPPHRVKSISMTSFTTEEMEFLKSRGNEFCRKVWLGLYDSRSHMEPDSKDETKIKDFMCQKYEKKRWYVAPTEAMHEDARKLNTPEKKETTKPLRTLVGDNVPGLRVLNNQSNIGLGKPVGAIQKPISKADTTAQLAQPPSSLGGGGGGGGGGGRSGVPDLLGELGNDPFANPSPAGQTTTPGGGFADFSSFNSQPASTGGSSGFPGPTTVNNVGLLQPLGTSAAAASNAPSTFPAFTASSADSTTTTASTGGGGGGGGGGGMGDRYAALADLDSVFGGGGGALSSNAGVPTPASVVNWMGAGTPGGITSTSIFGAASSPAGSTVSGGFGATDSAWPSVSAEPCVATHSTSNPFLVSNPFGGGGQQPTASVSNPFMAGGQTTQAGFAQFGQPATGGGGGGGGGGFAQFGQTTASTPSASQGFASFGQTQTSTASAAQFGMQNGSFGGHQPAPWGMPAAQGQVGGFGTGTGTPQQAGLGFGAGMPAGQFAQKTAPAAFGMPQASTGMTGFGGWGAQQPAGNPFMSVGQQQAIPPRSNSTNPFL